MMAELPQKMGGSMLDRIEVKIDELDTDWIELIQVARDMDIPIGDIRAFLSSGRIQSNEMMLDEEFSMRNVPAKMNKVAKA
jgi:DNA-binding transcriptional MerR regulator